MSESQQSAEQLFSQLTQWRQSLYNGNIASARMQMGSVFASDATFHMCAPFGDYHSPADWFDACVTSLADAMPDLERRDYIVISGIDADRNGWIGCAGYYCGTFIKPWLDIPPTGHFAHMRFHEFYRMEGDVIVEAQIIWDISELMMQANAWPLVPSLGREGLVPAPATCDGIENRWSAHSEKSEKSKKSEVSRQHVLDMLEHLQRYPSQGGPEVMAMDRFWHHNLSWYGPAGIGTCRGIAGFRHWHQIPFLNAMPDRGQHEEEIHAHFFASGEYVAVTGWPNMCQTLTHGGWLGIAPSGKKITLRSLDFWRLEDGKIRENWVLVDLIDVYSQLGIDVIARMKEFNKARVIGDIQLPQGM